MIIQCPHCGKTVMVNGLGRKRLNIPLKNISDCLRAHRNVVTAANELGCSPAYIFGILKVNGLKLKDVISATKDTRLLHKGAESGGW
ncbi:hypothetical protein ES703_43446 [subsurface metagenome]